MAHFQKFNWTSMGHVLEHYEHKKARSNVKSDLTKYNYNLADKIQPLPQMEFIHKRLQNVKVQHRKDINYLCTWTITQPKGLPKEYTKKFFDEVFKFMCTKVDKNNIVSSWVHVDEPNANVHTHFCFLPIVKNNGKSAKRFPEKLSAKEAVTKKDLQTFHQELSQHMERAFGYDIGILNGSTIGGNKSIEELKLQSLQNKYEELQNKHIGTYKEQMIKQSELNKLNREIENCKKTINDYKNQIEQQEQKKIQTLNEIADLQKQKNVILSKVSDLARKGKKIQNGVIDRQNELKDLQGQIEGVKRELSSLRTKHKKEKSAIKEWISSQMANLDELQAKFDNAQKLYEEYQCILDETEQRYNSELMDAVIGSLGKVENAIDELEETNNQQILYPEDEEWEL